MPQYRYLARDLSGRQQSGLLVAESPQQLVARLRENRLLVLQVAEVKEGQAREKLPWNPLEYRPMCLYDVERDFHQLAVMLRSGLPLLETLKITADHARYAVRKVWRQVAGRVSEGDSFMEALAEHRVFDRLVLAMVRVGEQTGNLDFVLEHASKELEARRNFKRQVLSALAYPSFVIVFAIGVAIFMLVKVVPEIKKFLAILGRKLPPITQALIDTSDWIEANGPGILLGLFVIGLVTALLRRVSWTRYAMDYAILKIPVFGPIAQLGGTVDFCRGLHTMLRSGVPIAEGLETVGGLLFNTYLAERVFATRSQVLRGEALSKPIGEKFGFPPLLYRMLVVGETSGTLEQILQEMTLFHESLLARRIRTMAAIMEPVVTIVVGGIVGFVYAAFLVAMFSAGGKG